MNNREYSTAKISQDIFPWNITTGLYEDLFVVRDIVNFNLYGATTKAEVRDQNGNLFFELNMDISPAVEDTYQSLINQRWLESVQLPPNVKATDFVSINTIIIRKPKNDILGLPHSLKVGSISNFQWDCTVETWDNKLERTVYNTVFGGRFDLVTGVTK